MIDVVYRLLLRAFGRLPRRTRRVLVRLGSPKYTVGAICLLRRADGRVLLVRHTYGSLWGTPGGLAKKGERPEHAAVREAFEEVGLHIELLSGPSVVVDPGPRRVDIVFLARPVDEATADSARPTSPEIERVGWFSLDELPTLQPETITAFGALADAGVIEIDRTPLDRMYPGAAG